jgi:hypothetical protein
MASETKLDDRSNLLGLVKKRDLMLCNGILKPHALPFVYKITLFITKMRPMRLQGWYTFQLVFTFSTFAETGIVI